MIRLYIGTELVKMSKQVAVEEALALLEGSDREDDGPKSEDDEDAYLPNP